MKIERFEDIEAWEKGHELCAFFYSPSCHSLNKDFALRDQIRRAAISVISNIAEGFERGGDKEFRQFLSVAKGSVGEVRAQLYVALDAGYLSEEQFQKVQQLCLSISKLIAGLMRYLQNSDYSGNKFKDDCVSDSLVTSTLDFGPGTLN